MGRLFVEYLPDGRKYACKECFTHEYTNIVHLASVTDLLSKSFHSRHGPAYLFNNAVNVTLGPIEERDMTTGKHEVRDIFCVGCGTNLGWRYERAYERRERYKEGKYILERLQMVDLDAATLDSTGNLQNQNSVETAPAPFGLQPPTAVAFSIDNAITSANHLLASFPNADLNRTAEHLSSDQDQARVAAMPAFLLPTFVPHA